MRVGLLRNPSVRGLANLYTGTLISGAGWAMLLPITPVLADYFDVSPGTAAQVVTAYALGRFFGIPGAGVLIDRFGSRKLLVGGPALVLVGALVGAGTPWFLANPRRDLPGRDRRQPVGDGQRDRWNRPRPKRPAG